MKLLSTGLFLTLILMNPSMADSSSLNKVLKCARNIVEKNRGGEEGIRFAGEVIENASIEKNNSEVLRNITRVCRSYQKFNKGKIVFDRNYLEDKISDLSISDSSKEILKSFNSPYYDCKFRNIEVQIAIGIGVGAGLGAAKCEGSNGRRYILLIPAASFNMGFIAGVFTRGSEIDDENQLISLAADDGHLAAGFFLAGIFDAGAELDQIGTGIGAGLAFGVGAQLRLKAIPLKNKFDSITEQM